MLDFSWRCTVADTLELPRIVLERWENSETLGTLLKHYLELSFLVGDSAKGDEVCFGDFGYFWFSLLSV